MNRQEFEYKMIESQSSTSEISKVIAQRLMQLVDLVHRAVLSSKAY